MKYIKFSLIMPLVIALMACSKVETVEYYEKNPDKAKKTLIECDNKKVKGKMDEKSAENCSNAGKAFMSNQMKSIFN
jgi:hypothetical protein